METGKSGSEGGCRKPNLSFWHYCGRLLRICSEQLKFVRGAQSGTGILKHGSMIVPMDITVDKYSSIYRLFSTNPFEDRKEAAREEGH